MRSTLAALVTVIGACGNGEEVECAIVQLDECLDCGPGEVRFGARVNGGAGAPQRAPRGVVLVTRCEELGSLDARAVPGPAIELDPFMSSSAMRTNFASPPFGGVTYHLTMQLRDSFDGDDATIRRLFALDVEGHVVWEHELPLTDLLDFVTPELLADHQQIWVLSSNGVVEAVTPGGDVRWRRLEQGRRSDVLALDGRGSAFALRGQSMPMGGVSQGTITLISSDNEDVWSRSVTSRPAELTDATGVWFQAAAASADGGVMAVGWHKGSSLEVGDLELTPRDSSGPFVASFDAAGATRWAYTLGEEGNLYGLNFASITALGDRLAVVGRYTGDGGLGLPPVDPYEYRLGDGFIAVFGADGLERAQRIPDGIPGGVVAVDDATVWLNVSPARSDADFRFGSRSFASPDGEHGTYVFNVVL